MVVVEVVIVVVVAVVAALFALEQKWRTIYRIPLIPPLAHVILSHLEKKSMFKVNNERSHTYMDTAKYEGCIIFL